jgi:dATP pyrophosphohydrolase
MAVLFRKKASKVEYAIFRRRDMGGIWQLVAGGGEDAETPEAAVQREVKEEAGIRGNLPCWALETTASVPAFYFESARKFWPKDLLVVPAHYFAMNASGYDLNLSDEHTEFEWLEYPQAEETLRFDADKTALWEVSEMLKKGQIK